MPLCMNSAHFLMWVHILRNRRLIRWRIDSELMCCRLIFTGLFCILLCINTNRWHRFSSQIGLQSPQPGQITPRRYNSNTVQVFQEVWQHVLWYVMWPHAAKTLHRMFSSLIKVILSCHIDVFCSSASGHGNLFETDPPSAFLSFTLCPPGFCPSVSPNIFLFISSSLSSCSLFFFQAWSNKFFLFQGLHFLLSLSLPPLHLISPLSPLSDTSLKPRLSY